MPIDRDELTAALNTLSVRAAELATAEPTEVRVGLPSLQSALELVRYWLEPKDGWTAPPVPEASIHGLRCSLEGCRNPPPFYNVAGLDIRSHTIIWRCRDHIPPEIIFPIGLHGDDYLSTGRKKPSDPRG